MRGKFTGFAAGAVLMSAGVPSSAGAEPGLTVDPQSPAGVEYQVPLDTGRRHGGGNGGHGHHGSGGSSSELFGSGITPSGSDSTGGGSSGGVSGPAGGSPGSGNGSAGSDGSGGSSGSNGGAGASRGSGGSGQSVAPVTASANYSSTGPLVGVIGGVLLLGGGFGLLLRLRARRSANPR